MEYRVETMPLLKNQDRVPADSSELKDKIRDRSAKVVSWALAT